MIALLHFVMTVLAAPFKSKSWLEAESERIGLWTKMRRDA
jgi:hypothetical protein